MEMETDSHIMLLCVTQGMFKCARTVISAAVAAKSLSRVRLCATPETAAHQVPLSTGFSRQEYWSGLPFPSPL